MTIDTAPWQHQVRIDDNKPRRYRIVFVVGSVELIEEKINILEHKGYSPLYIIPGHKETPASLLMELKPSIRRASEHVDRAEYAEHELMATGHA